MLRHGRCSCLLLLVAVVGCGGGAPDDAPDVAPVTGKISRKGAPLPNVSVTFQPLDAPEGMSNPSTGFTNDAGEYEMVLNRSTTGVVPGKHQVNLMAQDGLDDDDPSKKAPDEVVIPDDLRSREITVPPEGLKGGEANIDLDF
ncbi:MAG: hypothetical protein ACK5Q5_17895 [Planctomycetaceae bacterium]